MWLRQMLTHGPTPQVAMLMISEFGIFPEVCGWFVDVCSLQLFGSTLESRFAFWKAHYHISTALVRPFVSLSSVVFVGRRPMSTTDSTLLLV
jgi:hypothetical protein